VTENRAIAIVGLGAILPDAFNVPDFWENIVNKRYSITDVPAERWNTALFYDPDPSAVDKSYTKIGAYVKGYQLDALKLGLPIPPKVLSMMDFTQQWAIAASSQALIDYGYPTRTLNPERVAVIFGNANAGEGHYKSTLRIYAPEYLDVLKSVPNFQQLPEDIQESLLDGMLAGIRDRIPNITEDTMPGELSNIIAGRVANVFNFSGPNFVTDAACASSLAALQAAVEGLEDYKFDAVLTGGIDRSMGPESYVKFSKIGALSADGSRPYADGANGFVMGEGAVVYLLKRLEDAEKDGDKIYAVVRGIGGSSDGKGKGITAPNPLGQVRAIERAWKDAGVSPATVGLIEGHGTSTKVGDVTEIGSLNTVFGPMGVKNGTVALGSVKSNIGHLKAAAGAVGVLKTTLALFHHTLPPSVNFDKPNPNIDFSNTPFYVNTQTQSWEVNPGEVRRAGISSFGFGGTNFHVVMEEYLPGMLSKTSEVFAIPKPANTQADIPAIQPVPTPMAAMTSVVVPSATISSAVDAAAIEKHVLAVVSEKTGYPPEMLDLELDLEADLGVDTVKQAELFAAIRTHYDIPRREDLRLSDYNTLKKVIGFVNDSLAQGNVVIADEKPIEKLLEVTLVKEVRSFAQDSEPKPYQGLFFLSANNRNNLQKGLVSAISDIKIGKIPPSICPPVDQVKKSERIAIDYSDQAELIKRCEKALSALESDATNAWQALQAQGIYRGSGNPGKVVFMFPGQGSQYVNMLRDLYKTEQVVADTFNEADRVMTPILGRSLTSFIYVEGDEGALAQAEKDLKNTAITQPAMLTANVALLRLMNKYGFEPDMVIGHSLGEYAALVAADVMSFPDALKVVSARGSEMTKIKVDDNGCMAAVSAPLEKVEEVLAAINGYVVIANINSPIQSVIGGETKAVDEAITKFTADGFQAVKIPVSHAFHTKIVAPASVPLKDVIAKMAINPPMRTIVANVSGDIYPTTKDEIVDILAAQVASPVQFVKSMKTLYNLGGRVFVEIGPKRVLNSLAADNLKEKAGVALLSTNHPRKGGKTSFNEALCGLYAAGIGGKEAVSPDQVFELSTVAALPVQPETQPILQDGRLPLTGSVVVSGAGLGLPGRNGNVFDDRNIESILHGDMRIDTLSVEIRKSMVEKKVTRLIKSDAGAVMQEIDDIEQTIKLAGQRGEFDLIQEFGVPEERVEALDISTQLAIAAGIEALRDAGIPLVMNYKKTSRGTFLPDRWKLPESMQDETGIIFCSAFPGLDRMAEESEKFTEHQVLTAQLDQLQTLMFQLRYSGESSLIRELEQRESELEEQIVNLNYHFDRRFVFRVLSMGHSQFAEYIGAKGPVTHVNAACATTTHAVSVAEDWIRAGRCRRVVIIAGDDVTNANLVQWIGTSMFASGAATIEGDVRKAALPFDKRRNGLILGMGAASLVVESEDACRERGVRGICEVVSTVIANSAFHGTRLDVKHVGQVMDRLVAVAEARFGLNRSTIAASTAFISHETYTPARGGSASAEIHALRDTFKEYANQVIIANTKGFTGHTMGVGVEDVVAVKILETGIVPPIAHIGEGFEPDPELGDLNLSKGGSYNPQFSLRLGAGFGSQIAMTLYRKIPGEGLRINNHQHLTWMAAAAGYQAAELEVVQRTMRIKNQGEPSLEPSKSLWEYGQGPSLWAAIEGTSMMTQQKIIVASVSTPSETKRSVVTEKLTAMSEVNLTLKPVEGPDNAQIKVHVLQEVSEKTGYPVEMLDLELDLEADLGIDTVKQAELFAAIRTHYGIPRREDLRLSEYNTLSKVIGFVSENLNLAADLTTTSQPVEGHKEEASVEELDLVKPLEVSTQMVESPVKQSSSTEYSSPEIQAHVLAVVSGKTGYPVEMLDLELDLEADLGIDTVKQAELFASIRTHYSIPRREDLRLSEYNTLSKVIGFVVENLKPVELPDVVPAKVLSAEGQEQAHVDVAGLVADSPAIRRRVPKPVLRPRLDLCIPTAVEIAEASRIVIVKDSSKTAEALAKKLKTRGAQVLVLDGADAVQKSKAWSESGLVQGVYYLPGLDADPEWQKSDLLTWKSAIHQRVEVLFDLMKVLPEKAFLLTGTRMGGLLGLLNPINPLGGAISGFTKALARERSDVLIKTVDFEAEASATLVASWLLEETLHDASVAEIGWESDLRYSAALVDEPAKEVDHKPLEQGTVFLVSGGTAGVVAPVVMDLVRSTKGKFYLLGRTNLPEKSDAQLAMLKTDREGLKKEFSQLISTAGQKATPVAVEQKVAALERAKSTLDLMDAVKAAGGEAEYLECDILDEGSVQKVLGQISQETKKVDVFIHAAGVEKSRKLESKTTEELHQVIDVKVDGFFNLFKAMEKTNLLPSSVVFFTSVAGRFGNSGQVDYSAANDMLSKYAAWLPTQYEGMQAISIDWGAWGEVGMASRGSIPMMMERAGIEMMNPKEASSYVYNELVAGTCGEVVVSASLGALESGKSGNNGLDVARADAALRAGNPDHIMLSHITSFEVQTGLSLETILDPNEQPFLRDHALNGIPVLPGVIGIEGFSVAARHIASKLAGEKSSFVVDHLEDIQFMTPFKFYKNLPRHIQWKAQAVRQAEGLVVYATLESELVRHNGQREHMLHFTGKIFLTQKPLSPEVSLQLPVWGDDVTVCADDIYKLYFHGPSFQVLDCVQKSGNFVMGRLAKNLPSGTNNGSSISTPLLVELCFQTAGLWEAGATGTMALPHSIGTLTIYPRKVNGEPIFAEVSPFMEDGKVSFDARVVDAKGHLYLELSNYQTAPLPYAADPGLIEPMKALLLN
jgi:malonyl CoA-acyl carrier protein transacylase